VANDPTSAVAISTPSAFVDGRRNPEDLPRRARPTPPRLVADAPSPPAADAPALDRALRQALLRDWGSLPPGPAAPDGPAAGRAAGDGTGAGAGARPSPAARVAWVGAAASGALLALVRLPAHPARGLGSGRASGSRRARGVVRTGGRNGSVRAPPRGGPDALGASLTSVPSAAPGPADGADPGSCAAGPALRLRASRVSGGPRQALAAAVAASAPPADGPAPPGRADRDRRAERAAARRAADLERLPAALGLAGPDV